MTSFDVDLQIEDVTGDDFEPTAADYAEPNAVRMEVTHDGRNLHGWVVWSGGRRARMMIYNDDLELLFVGVIQGNPGVETLHVATMPTSGARVHQLMRGESTRLIQSLLHFDPAIPGGVVARLASMVTAKADYAASGAGRYE